MVGLQPFSLLPFLIIYPSPTQSTQQDFPTMGFLVFFLLLFHSQLGVLSQNTTTVNVGVIVQLDWFGKVARSAFELAEEDINAINFLGNNTLLRLHLNDSGGDPVRAASAAYSLLEEEVLGIIGPQTSQESEFVAQLCNSSAVPVISFSATDPSLSWHRYPYFFRLPHSDAVQTKALAALVSHYGWRNVAVIYTDNDYGTGILSSLSESLHSVNSEIMSRSAISPSADEDSIREVLYQLMGMQTRVFVVHTTAQSGAILFEVAQQIGMMESDYAWIITEGFAAQLEMLEPDTLEDMNGVLATRTFISKGNSTTESFRRRWKAKFLKENKEDAAQAFLNVYGYFAYDAVWMLALAIRGVNINGFKFSPKREDGLKYFQGGEKMRELLSETEFQGVSGTVKMQEGEPVGSLYEILNIVGKSYQRVGFWQEDPGLSTQIKGPKAGKLGPVIWPGRSLSAPRGWVQPTVSKKAKVAVPLRLGYKEFVTSRKKDSGEGFEITGGFVIDIFDAVLDRLPYAFPHEFVAVGNGKTMPGYDDIVQQVFHKRYDAAVGDFTILANRSNYVDLTQPFFESGLSMVVPVTKADGSTAWAFMRPFTPAMWLATGGFFLFTGFVVWLLEHKRNDRFRGKPSEQVVTLLWFSFSTLFFAQREKIVSSLARGVIIIWLFVVLILTSSYTASLTSMLTVQQIEPTVKSLEYLKASGANIGYQAGSFVGGFLINQVGIEEKRLKTYKTAEEYNQALSKREVAAIFDELPYIKVFLAKYCGYTTVGPTYRTGGLGFVFPKGSPLVSDMSKAVLELSESSEMERLQKKWFNSTACTSTGVQVDSNRLSMESFWGLYLITGTASVVALLIFFGRLIYRYVKHGNGEEESEGSPAGGISRHLKSFANLVDKKEPSREEKKQRESSHGGGIPVTPMTENSPMSISTFGFGRASGVDSQWSSPRSSFVSVDINSDTDNDSDNDNGVHGRHV